MKRVLFIGNSHTYFNDMPFLFQCFTQSEKAKRDGTAPAYSTMITHGGRLLSEHIAEPEVKYNIRFGHYDYVVIQQAAHPFPGRESLLRDGGILAEWACKAGAVPVAYMTWAEERAPEHQAAMTEAYEALCSECAAEHMLLAPVGRVWEQVQKDPNAPVHLFYTDGKHASLYGSYLAACVICQTITGKSPVGLPAVFALNGKTIYELEPQNALYLQQMADKYCWLDESGGGVR